MAHFKNTTAQLAEGVKKCYSLIGQKNGKKRVFAKNTLFFKKPV